MSEKKILRCAIYTRKSTEEGLDMDYNTLDAQREAGENALADVYLLGKLEKLDEAQTERLQKADALLLAIQAIRLRSDDIEASFLKGVSVDYLTDQAWDTASTLGAGGIEALQSSLEPATTTLMAIAPYLEAAKWALLVITLVGIGVMLWARIDDSRKGLR